LQPVKRIYRLFDFNKQNNFVNKIIQGNSLNVLRAIPDETVNLVITSPPYFQQRNYGNGKYGIGNEKTEKSIFR
jgi:site-specific DNA-methyltransferase (adenine-specific)